MLEFSSMALRSLFYIIRLHHGIQYNSNSRMSMTSKCHGQKPRLHNREIPLILGTYTVSM